MMSVRRDDSPRNPNLEPFSSPMQGEVTEADVQGDRASGPWSVTRISEVLHRRFLAPVMEHVTGGERQPASSPTWHSPTNASGEMADSRPADDCGDKASHGGMDGSTNHFDDAATGEASAPGRQLIRELAPGDHHGRGQEASSAGNARTGHGATGFEGTECRDEASVGCFGAVTQWRSYSVKFFRRRGVQLRHSQEAR